MLTTNYRSWMKDCIFFKGLLFATGQFTPFQDFGVWTNHMPLAFLIPGQIQEWFGAGLRTGRYFSIFLSILMLIGLWLTVKGLSGKWWAAGAIWAYALNPAAVKLYTIAISQAIIACMFVWMLFFCLGKEKRIWQLIIAGAISGLMIFNPGEYGSGFPHPHHIYIVEIWMEIGDCFVPECHDSADHWSCSILAGNIANMG